MFQLSKKRIILIIVVWILLLASTTGVTWYLYKDNDNRSKQVNNMKPYYNELDYYTFYDENDLKVNKRYIDEERKYQRYEYIEISGLRNKKLQNKINKELYDTVKEGSNNNATSIHSRLYLNAFNILSVMIETYYDDKDITKEFYNYDLNTGDYIKFDDLFTNTSNIFSIVYDGCYNKLSTDISFSLLSLNKQIQAAKIYNENGAVSQYYVNKSLDELEQEKKSYEEKMTNIENLSIEYSKQVMDISEKNFLITNYGIILYDEDNKEITIRARNNMEYMAYYEKYMNNKNLYEKDNVGLNNLFLSGNNNAYLTYNRVEKVKDYALIDFEKWDIDVNDNEINYIDKKINEYKNKLDKNLFSYININSNYNSYSDSNIDSLYGNIILCTMSKDYYNSVYYKKLFLIKENTMYSYNNYYKDDNIKCNNQNVGVIYVNDMLYDKVEDIFKDDFDYQGYLIAEYYKSIKELYDEGKLDELKSKFNFGFTGYAAIYIDYLDNNSDTYSEVDVTVSIDKVPKEYLKIDISLS